MYSDDLETFSGSASETSESDSTDRSHVEQQSTSATSAKPRKRKCPPRKRVFKDNWLQVTEFKNWLSKKTAPSGEMKPFCKLCTNWLTCSMTAIKRHAASQKHQARIKMSATTGSIAQLMRQTTNSDATTSMEIKLCAFITQHNLPLSISEDIVELLRSLFPNDAALSYLKLGKQKATNIVRQVLGFDYLKEMVALLRSRKFSVIIDEATDKSVKKQLAIIATFFDIEKFEVQYWLVDMIETEDGSATGIYAKMKETFLQHNIPMRNIIGYSSDTTNVMFGQYNSVSQLLKSEFSYVQLVKCSCHLIHLVSSHAALKLPKGVEDLCRDVYAHFSRSSKRQDVYKEFQAFFNAQPLKILSPAQTRWLSLQECVNRLLEQFEALTRYFTLTANEDPSHSNDRILASLQNRFTQAYLEFLSYQLERLNAFNRLFQSERPLLHMLKPEIESLIKSIACDFMKIDIVKSTSPNKLNPTDVNQHVPLSETYVGLGATATIHEIASVAGKADVDNFLTTCKNFLIESILQIQSRFDLDDPVHEIVQCLLPSNAAALKPRSLRSICQKLPYLKDTIDLNKLDMEWRQHALEPKAKPELHWDEYWLNIRDTTTPTGEAKYPLLMAFVSILASLPFSNVSVEIIFSQLKLVKTDQRNSLKSTSLVSLLQAKMRMKNEHLTAASLRVHKGMLELAAKMKSYATDEETKELRKELLSKLS
jgi:hypothetical protein